MGALAGLVEKGLVAPDWAEALAPVDERIAAMGRFLRAEIAAGRAYLPAGDHILRAFQRPLADVRVLIVGQDPYPTPGHPIGLSFAVDAHVRPLPPSLRNIYQELGTDLGVDAARARRPDRLGRPGGDAAQPGADRAARRVRLATAAAAGRRSPSARSTRSPAAAARCAAILWGRDAQSLKPLLGPVPWVESVHPSPLSAQPRVLRVAAVQPGQPAARGAGRRSPSTGRYQES